MNRKSGPLPGVIFGDFGTSWTKILDTRDGSRSVVPSGEAGKLRVGAATGRNSEFHSRIQVNELVALARGAGAILGPSCRNAVVLDIGARDMKFVRIADGNVASMDWNGTCGALTGFTLELLGRHFSIDFARSKPAAGEISLTCGVLGMERIFDRISSGEPPQLAVAEFARGLATLAHRFAGSPEILHLSGGMCENRLFLKSFPRGVRVKPLGRFVLLEGVAAEYANVS